MPLSFARPTNNRQMPKPPLPFSANLQTTPSSTPPSSCSSSTTSSSNPICDKSTATSSTEDMSFASMSSTTLSSSNNVSSANNIVTSHNKSIARPLHVPIPMHSHSSLLDTTMDESHEDEASLDQLRKYSGHLSKSYNHHSLMDTTNDSSFNQSYDLGSSIMEQTEKNLVAISESMTTGSFCAQGNDIHNSCTMPDCTLYSDENDSSKKGGLFSDTLVQNRLFSDFHYLLGSDVLPCCEEKSLLANCLGGSSIFHMYYNEEEGAFSSALEREDSRKIRNRAGESWRARAYRIRKLREERMVKSGDNFTTNMYSSAGATIVPYTFSNRRQLSMERAIGKSHSTDGTTFFQSPIPVKQQNGCLSASGCDWQSTRRPKHEVNSDPLGRMIGDCIEPIAPSKEDSVELEIVWKQDPYADLCYDSDPGETSFRTSLLNSKNDGDEYVQAEDKKGSKKAQMTRSQSLVFQTDEAIKSHVRNRNRRNRNRYSSFDRKNDENYDHFLGGNDSFDIHVSFEQDDVSFGEHHDHNDEDYDSVLDEDKQMFGSTPKLNALRKHTLNEDFGIAHKVQDALNHTWTLTWHPANNTHNDFNSTSQSPRCVRLWFERGNRIRGNNIVEPKLMWRDAYNPDLSSLRKLNDSITKGPQQICLLSICRILEVKEIVDRTKYPFAKKTCSFIIRTCEDEEFLFETQNELERDNIVYMWKLVVARLASQAVVGDGDKMVGEFFVPASLGVQKLL